MEWIKEQVEPGNTSGHGLDGQEYLEDGAGKMDHLTDPQHRVLIQNATRRAPGFRIAVLEGADSARPPRSATTSASRYRRRSPRLPGALPEDFAVRTDTPLSARRRPALAEDPGRCGR